MLLKLIVLNQYNYIPSKNGYNDIYNLKKKNKCCCSIY